jgi:hypothetical protein
MIKKPCVIFSSFKSFFLLIFSQKTEIKKKIMFIFPFLNHFFSQVIISKHSQRIKLEYSIIITENDVLLSKQKIQ